MIQIFLFLRLNMLKYKLSYSEITDLLDIYKILKLNKKFFKKYYELCELEIDSDHIDRIIQIAININANSKVYLHDIKELLHTLSYIGGLLKDKLTYYVPNFRQSINRADYIRNMIQTPRFKLNAENLPELSTEEMKEFRKLLLLNDHFNMVYDCIQTIMIPLLIKEYHDKDKIKAQKSIFLQNINKGWFIHI